MKTQRTREEIWESIKNDKGGIKETGVFSNKEAMSIRSYLVHILEIQIDIRDLLTQSQEKPRGELCRVTVEDNDSYKEVCMELKPCKLHPQEKVEEELPPMYYGDEKYAGLDELYKAHPELKEPITHPLDIPALDVRGLLLEFMAYGREAGFPLINRQEEIIKTLQNALSNKH